MKKTLLSILALGVAFGASAQTFTPAAGSPLANGEVGTAYSETINAAIPATTNVTGQQILDVLPAQAVALVGSYINAGTSYPVAVTSTALTVAGLPAGLSDDCGGCSVAGGATRDIVISGTPTAGGGFTVDITSETTGSVDITVPILGTQTVPFGGSFQGQSVPTLPGLMDAQGYSMNVSSTGIKEANEVFSLGFYPNPTEGLSTLDINSTVAGQVSVEVYAITGAIIQTNTRTIRMGANRLSLDLSSVPAGIYMIKAEIDGHQALIRTVKK
ncbi:MAG: T9SS type A sorting domain-containing protein [Flavobacteriales bacterium]|nr:T9SS type A sorting domain-containing protein [Flavobacteriales bacterium]